MTTADAAAHLAAWRNDRSNFTLLTKYAFEGAKYDRAEVVAVIDEYMAALTPGEHKSHTKALALQLPYLESNARKHALLNTYSADDVDEPAFRFADQVLLAMQGHASNWLRESRDNPNAMIYAAQTAAARGDYDRADELLQHARCGQIDGRAGAVHFNDTWHDDLDEAAQMFVGMLPPVAELAVDTAKRRVFVGCDWKYYERYGHALVNSLAASGTDAGLHLHLFDVPAGQQISSDVSFTMEDTRQPHAERRFYYAAIRLFRLWQLMEREPMPTIFLDSDLFVGASLDPLFARLDKADLALCRMPGRLPFHTQMNASVCGFTERSLPYLRRVAGYIAKCFMSDCVPWCLDQISLSCVLREMQARAAAPKTVAVGPAVYDGTYDAVLWPQNVPPDSPWHERWLEARGQWA